jgi:cytochrome c-type biogenesis protein CcmH/NrfF
MDKAIWTVRTAKLCPKCIKEMEAEYIVYLTHEQQRNRMKDIATHGYCDRCHEESLMLCRLQVARGVDVGVLQWG